MGDAFGGLKQHHDLTFSKDRKSKLEGQHTLAREQEKKNLHTCRTHS